jgi:hypothetical protein
MTPTPAPKFNGRRAPAAVATSRLVTGVVLAVVGTCPSGLHGFGLHGWGVFNGASSETAAASPPVPALRMRHAGELRFWQGLTRSLGEAATRAMLPIPSTGRKEMCFCVRPGSGAGPSSPDRGTRTSRHSRSWVHEQMLPDKAASSVEPRDVEAPMPAARRPETPCAGVGGMVCFGPCFGERDADKEKTRWWVQ